MNFLNGLIIIIIYQLVGEVFVLSLEIPIHGPVVGMFLLFISLLLKRRMPESLDYTSTSLLSHLSLLFIPAGVGVMVHFERIAKEWIPISFALTIGTLATLAISALVMQGFSHLLGSRADD